MSNVKVAFICVLIPAEVRLLRLLEDIWHQMCSGKFIRRVQKQNHRLTKMLSVL